MAPRIVLLHATPVAMAPVQAAFAALWPEAETVDALEGLSLDRARDRPRSSPSSGTGRSIGNTGLGGIVHRMR